MITAVQLQREGLVPLRRVIEPPTGWERSRVEWRLCNVAQPGALDNDQISPHKPRERVDRLSAADLHISPPRAARISDAPEPHLPLEFRISVRHCSPANKKASRSPANSRSIA